MRRENEGKLFLKSDRSYVYYDLQKACRRWARLFADMTKLMESCAHKRGDEYYEVADDLRVAASGWRCLDEETISEQLNLHFSSIQAMLEEYGRVLDWRLFEIQRDRTTFDKKSGFELRVCESKVKRMSELAAQYKRLDELATEYTFWRGRVRKVLKQKRQREQRRRNRRTS